MNNGVTIGIPVYNEQHRIERCIRSAAPQCETLIVADNCSTDNTEQVCRRLLKEFSNMRYFRHSENMGALKNGTFIFEKIETPFYMTLGSHDYIDDDYIEKLLAEMKKSNEVELVVGELWFDYDSFVEPAVLFSEWSTGLNEDPFQRTWSMLFDWNYSQWAIYGLFRTETFKKLHASYLPPYGPDVVLLARTAKLGKIVIVRGTRYYGWIRKDDSSQDYMNRILAGKDEKLDVSSMKNEFVSTVFDLIGSFFPSPGLWKMISLRFRMMVHFGTFKRAGRDVAFYILYAPVKIWRKVVRLR